LSQRGGAAVVASGAKLRRQQKKFTKVRFHQRRGQQSNTPGFWLYSAAPRQIQKLHKYIFAPKMEKSEVTSICHLTGLLFECVESDWQTSSWKGFTGMQTQAKISRNERNLMT
jgi:hypothetical protein